MTNLFTSLNVHNLLSAKERKMDIFSGLRDINILPNVKFSDSFILGSSIIISLALVGTIIYYLNESKPDDKGDNEGLVSSVQHETPFNRNLKYLDTINIPDPILNEGIGLNEVDDPSEASDDTIKNSDHNANVNNNNPNKYDDLYESNTDFGQPIQSRFSYLSDYFKAVFKSKELPKYEDVPKIVVSSPSEVQAQLEIVNKNTDTPSLITTNELNEVITNSKPLVSKVDVGVNTDSILSSTDNIPSNEIIRNSLSLRTDNLEQVSAEGSPSSSSILSWLDRTFPNLFSFNTVEESPRITEVNEVGVNTSPISTNEIGVNTSSILTNEVGINTDNTPLINVTSFEEVNTTPKLTSDANVGTSTVTFTDANVNTTPKLTVDVNVGTNTTFADANVGTSPILTENIIPNLTEDIIPNSDSLLNTISLSEETIKSNVDKVFANVESILFNEEEDKEIYEAFVDLFN